MTFKINKISIIIIQHIAVSDLTYTISTLAPAAISLLANSWVLGKALCYTRVYFGYFAFPAGMSLIAVLTKSKFLILKYPLRALSWPTKRAHQVCSFIWAFALIFPILFFVVDKDDVHFDYRGYNCDYGYHSDAWKKLIPIIGFIFTFVPKTIIVVTTFSYTSCCKEICKTSWWKFPMARKPHCSPHCCCLLHIHLTFYC